MSKQLCPSDDEEMRRVGEDMVNEMRKLMRRQFALFSISTPVFVAFKIDPKKVLIEEMGKFISNKQ